MDDSKKVIFVRVNEEHYQELAALAAARGLQLGTYVRMLLLNHVGEKNAPHRQGD